MGVYKENGSGTEKEAFPSSSVESLELEFKNLSIGNERVAEESAAKEENYGPYPQRLDEPDCSFYMRTGICKYGMNCRFNHPTSRKNQGKFLDSSDPGQVKEKEELPERVGQPECKYYKKTGSCKFGKACRYHHPREKNDVGGEPELNFLGLPIRPGEKECPFYMRTGACKFATSCRFHHPEPTAVGGCDPLPAYAGGGSLPLHTPGTSMPPMPSWPMQSASNELGPSFDASTSYVPVMLAPPQGVIPTGWNEYQVADAFEHQALISPMFPPERSPQLHPAAPINAPKKPDHITYQPVMPPSQEFPERPGQPECQYFMKNGDCKFRSACRYHHPKTRVSKSPACALSPMGLPLRPNQAICSHYSRFGICKFGPACKFDHPVDHGNSTSSPTMVQSPSFDAPVMRS